MRTLLIKFLGGVDSSKYQALKREFEHFIKFPTVEVRIVPVIKGTGVSYEPQMKILDEWETYMKPIKIGHFTEWLDTPAQFKTVSEAESFVSKQHKSYEIVEYRP